MPRDREGKATLMTPANVHADFQRKYDWDINCDDDHQALFCITIDKWLSAGNDSSTRLTAGCAQTATVGAGRCWPVAEGVPSDMYPVTGTPRVPGNVATIGRVRCASLWGLVHGGGLYG